jgi:hypothetical protein
MKTRFLTIFSAIFLLASPAFAAQCYVPKEAEAEQGIRIHSELMVIGLNCQHNNTANGVNLYTAYREFTTRHEKLFTTYNEIILKHFKDNGQSTKEAEASLNTLRTNFANKISNDSARMRPDMFCARYAPRIVKASTFDHNSLRKWSATIFPDHPVSKPLCASN